MKTRVVNKYKESYEVYIGRGSIFGNPYAIGKDGSREEVIEKYRLWFKEQLKDLKFYVAVQKLKGKRLGCFCKPAACHGDVIVDFLEHDAAKGYNE